MSTWVQCDRCDKWRRVRMSEEELPEQWYCELNDDPAYASCDVAEEQMGEEEGEGEGEDSESEEENLGPTAADEFERMQKEARRRARIELARVGGRRARGRCERAGPRL